MDRLEWLRIQSKNLSQAEDQLLLRIQRIIKNRAEIDAEIDQLERQ